MPYFESEKDAEDEISSLKGALLALGDELVQASSEATAAPIRDEIYHCRACLHAAEDWVEIQQLKTSAPRS